MKEPFLDMSTDLAWEEWGRRDPYYGVITDPMFRRAAMTDEARREFFSSSELHAQRILTTIRKHIEPEFAPRKILDFGCGVGRVLVAFAKMAEEVFGLDVSPSMLEEARRNCSERGLSNVRFVHSDDYLSTFSEKVDLVHSYIVFQHIPVARGRTILSTLLRRLRPGGVAAIQLTYSKTRFAATHGLAPPEHPSSESAKRAISEVADPDIQMNSYNLTEMLFLVQSCGAERCHVEFTDHGGELGVFLFFSVPGSS
jgi:ubiquinone/menaquinone biosynthesis C-methylase UbiE